MSYFFFLLVVCTLMFTVGFLAGEACGWRRRQRHEERRSYQHQKKMYENLTGANKGVKIPITAE